MNVIEIFAKFVMDTSSLDDGLKDAEKKTSSFGSAIGSGLAGAAKLGAAALATTATAVVGTATAVAAVAKQSADAYAQYQQLSGGIETLFENQEAVNAVMANASNAYKTAGMSSNQYMDTVINMAASLNKATGDTVESARLADVAITDMADNVNKMGTTMEGVQNAYRGFTRGNFTMLDNLALGYAGTKEGMEELLADAEKISGIKYDISSYADIVNAIHVVQEEMGITGTTAAEASETISGSAGALAAAWDNLILGLADSNADLGELVDNVVQSAKTAFTNIIPAFTQAVRGIGDLVGQLAPVIADELPGLVDQVLPPLLDAASSLISSVIEAIPGLLGVLEQNSDMLMSSFMGIIDTVLSGLYEFVVKDLDSLLTTLVDNVITPLLAETPHLLATLINIAGQILSSLASQLPALITNLVQTIVDLFGVLVDADNITYYIGIAEEIIGALMTGLLKAFPILLKALPDLISGLLAGLLDGFEMIVNDLMTEATPLLEELIPAVYETLGRIFPELANKVLPLLDNFAKNTVPRLVETWTQIFRTEFPKILATMLPLINDLIIGVVQALTMIVQYVPMIVEAIVPLVPVITQAVVDVLPEVLPILVDATTQLFVAFMEQWPVWFGAIISGVAIIFGVLLETTVAQMAVIFTAAENMFNNAGQTLAEKLEGVKTMLLEFFGPLLELLAPFFEAYQRYFEALGNLIETVFTKIYEAVKSRLEEVQAVWEAAWTVIMYFLQPILDDFTFWFEELLNIISAGVDDCIFWFEDMKTQIDTIIDNLINDALFWGADLISNFVDGIVNNMDKVTDAIDGITEFIDDNVGFSEPEEGPLSDFHTFAPDMMELFAKGVKDNKGLVKSAVSDAFDLGGMITGGMPTGGAQMPGLITPTASQPVQVTLVLDKQQLGKVVFDLNNQERQRVGVTLGKEAFA